ncbi:reductive dehalogenase domain-containing protein [Methanobrevibacter sp.]|uniref:reductive dehalogenase domain-containing protein n=1 Tax=Methanobrevibacter sp. TaxID=66852 RepID=UPI0025FDC8A7|nr:reductive dehalogenase domain-containing protein [Methanobrevibacter sp.]MBQ6098376.1 epoxyqueuosine reductase [Methanobrevibacter sp.]MBQ6513070.1 epoxyqueuosine reductase [Methanobrevibacter sp.]
MDEVEKYLLELGVSKVGYADVDGLASEFIDLPNGISLVLKLPKKAMQLVEDEDYKEYWKCFHAQIAKLTEIALKGEEYIKNLGYNAFALTMSRNECDMEKLLSILPYKTIATKSGLGWIGRSALFVTPEYGSAVALGAILTDMPLEFGEPVTDSECDDCENCQKACPVGAINPQKWNDRLNREDIIDIEVCGEYIIDQYKAGLGCTKCMSECKLTQEYLKRE